MNGLKGKSVNPKKFTYRLRIVLLVLVVLFSVYFLMRSSLFRVTRLEVHGNDRVSTAEVIALSGLVPGINSLQFDADACAKAIETNPLIKKALVQRSWIKTVVIQITERQTWAIIPYGDTFLCIDESGIYFDKLNNLPINDYPIITMDDIPQNITLGQAINTPAIDIIRQVWQALPATEQPMISEFHYQNADNTLKIYTVKGTEVRFGDLERLDEKMKNLAQVFQMEKDFDQQGKEVLDYVDIRFTGEPVLKTRD
jgi:cell division protein FtsQ